MQVEIAIAPMVVIKVGNICYKAARGLFPPVSAGYFCLVRSRLNHARDGKQMFRESIVSSVVNTRRECSRKGKAGVEGVM